MYGRTFYDAVSDALTGFLPPSMRDFRSDASYYNLKCWFGDEGREHYEIQHFAKGKRFALEIGFHTEHKDKQRNDDVLRKLTAQEKVWRKALGAEPEVGTFIGQKSGPWRRISEVWDDNDDEAVPVEAAERLASYIRAIEPLRTT